MTRSLRLLRALTGAVLVAVVLLVGGSAVLTATGVLRLRAELSDSMAPALHVGDLVAYRSATAGAVRPGDVISFAEPGRSLPVTHRVLAAKPDGDLIAFTTRGDANPTADLEPAEFLRGDRVWVVRGHVPHLGAVYSALTGLRGVPFVAGLELLYLLLPRISRLLSGQAGEPSDPAEPVPDPDREPEPAGAA